MEKIKKVGMLFLFCFIFVSFLACSEDSEESEPFEWVQGFPICSVTNDISIGLQVKLSSAGTVYYVVLADGSSVPSTQNVKEGQDASDISVPISGNKNVTSGIENIDISGLNAASVYDIYLVAEDSNGALQQDVMKLDVTTTILADVIAPTWVTNPVVGSITGTTILVDFEVDENCTLYYIVLVAGAITPSSTNVIAGQNDSGTPLTNDRKGSIAVNANVGATIAVDSLNENTSYKICLVVQDTAGNVSTVKEVTGATLADLVAPSWIMNPSLGITMMNTIPITFQVDESGTVFYVVLTNNAAVPTVQQITNGQNATGTSLASDRKGSYSGVTANENKTINVGSLSIYTTYKLCLVVVDAAGNGSLVKDVTATTAANGPAPTYDELFSIADIKTIHMHITVEEWNGLLNDFDANPKNEVYRKANFYYGADTNTSFRFNNVGFRIRGNGSRTRPESSIGILHVPGAQLLRAHFKIKFNEQFERDDSCYGAPSQDVATITNNQGREFIENVKGLNLKRNKDDTSCIREVLSYDLFHRFGVMAPRATFTKLYIKIGSESSKYMGVFTMFESMNKDWIQKRFAGISSYLFKCLWQGFGPADLNTTDPDNNPYSDKIGMEVTDPNDPNWATVGNSAYRPSYDLKTKTTEFIAAQDKFNELITLLQGSPTKIQLEEKLDVDALLKAQALHVLIGASDDYWRWGNNYYMLYRPDTLKWMFIPYDYDCSFGGPFWYLGDRPATSSVTNWGSSHNGDVTPVLMEKVLAIPEFFTSYTNYFRILCDESTGIFSYSAVETSVQQLQSLISAHATGYDSNDPVPYEPYSINTIGDSPIMDFVSGRTNVVYQEVHY